MEIRKVNSYFKRWDTTECIEMNVEKVKVKKIRDQYRKGQSKEN